MELFNGNKVTHVVGKKGISYAESECGILVSDEAVFHHKDDNIRKPVCKTCQSSVTWRIMRGGQK